MATMYNNEKSGVLFINDKKNPNDPEDKQPNFTGNIEIGGIKYSLSAWTREYEKDGEKRKLISMRATHPDDMKKFSTKEEPNNNDIPF
jgi:hypothetical protein